MSKANRQRISEMIQQCLREKEEQERATIPPTLATLMASNTALLSSVFYLQRLSQPLQIVVEALTDRTCFPPENYKFCAHSKKEKKLEEKGEKKRDGRERKLRERNKKKLREKSREKGE